MRLALDRASFSGHETFPFRWRWLKKGVDAVRQDEGAFGRDEAMVTLGVGKNMVRSIRHWCLATQMLQPVLLGERERHGALRVSPIGERLLVDGGWDPYLDDVASLWLIHWLLVSNAAMATTWYMAFTVLNEPEFTRERLASFIENHTALRHVRVSGPSLARDVDCFLRTYVPPVRGKGVSFEDSLECPLVELGLIQSVSASDGYRFVIGPKPSLPTAVFGFALAAYLKERSSEGSATTAVEECLYGPGSPGQAFKLDENSFVQLVEGLSDLGKGVIGLSDTAGVRRIYHSQVMDPVTMLAGQYEGRGVIAI